MELKNDLKTRWIGLRLKHDFKASLTTLEACGILLEANKKPEWLGREARLLSLLVSLSMVEMRLNSVYA